MTNHKSTDNPAPCRWLIRRAHTPPGWWVTAPDGRQRWFWLWEEAIFHLPYMQAGWTEMDQKQ